MSRPSISPAKRVVTLAIIVMVVALAVVYVVMRWESEPTVELNKAAPNFELGVLGGEYLSLEEFQGQIVLLNFWATWCEPCRDEMPAMQQVYEEYRDQGVTVLGINLMETEVAVKGFVEQISVTFPILYDLTGEVHDMYLVRPLPTSYFIDRRGIVRFMYIGPMTLEEMRQRIDRLLALP